MTHKSQNQAVTDIPISEKMPSVPGTLKLQFVEKL